MKPLIITTLTLSVLCSVPASAQDTYVKGYHRDDGTYVEPHYRSQPDSYGDNNYSAQGNINPYTGNYGTVNPPTIGSGGENDSAPLEYRGRPSSYRRIR